MYMFKGKHNGLTSIYWEMITSISLGKIHHHLVYIQEKARK